MTEEIVGILEFLTPRDTTKGTAYDMQIRGKLISTFRPGTIKVGDNLKVLYNENGSYLRAASIEVVPVGTVAEKPADKPQPGLPVKQTILPAFQANKTKVSDTALGMLLKEACRALPNGTKEQIKARAKMLLEIDQELKAELL